MKRDIGINVFGKFFFNLKFIYNYILKCSWDASVEKAWLSLFRFVEFWMGLSYTEPDKVHITLAKIKIDSRLPGGQIDTEYVNEYSRGGAKSRREVLAEMMAAEPDDSSDSTNHTHDGISNLPQWLRDKS